MKTLLRKLSVSTTLVILIATMAFSYLGIKITEVRAASSASCVTGTASFVTPADGAVIGGTGFTLTIARNGGCIDDFDVMVVKLSTLAGPPATCAAAGSFLTLGSILSGSSTLATINTTAVPFSGDGTDYCFRIRSSQTLSDGRTALVTVDNTAPVVLANTTRDLDFDGQIDAIDLSFTEANGMNTARTSTSGFAVAGHTLGATGTWIGQVFRITIDEISPAGDTGATPAVTYTNPLGATGLTDNAIDGLGNFVNYLSNTLPATTDGAAPAPVSSMFLDNNGDGTVDRIAVTMSETVGTYTNDNAAWTFPANTALNLAVTGFVSTVGAVVTLTVSADAGETSASPLPTGVYTDTAGSLLNDAGANIQSGPTTAVTIIDASAPQITIANVQQVNGTNTVAAVTWSEVLANGGALTTTDITYTDVSAGGAASLTAVSFSNGSATGTITVNTAFNQGDVGFDTVVGFNDGTPANDGTNNTGGGLALALIDDTAPTITTIFTRDVDEDGFIDRIELNANENLNAAGTTAGFTVAGHTISAITFTSVGGGTNNRATLTINETATGFTNELPNVTYDSVPGDITDADGNTTGMAGGGDLASFGPTAPTDGAAPQILSADVQTITGANLTMFLTFSEAIANGAALVAGDFTYVDVSTTGAATLATVTVANAASTGTATVNVPFIQGDVGFDTIALSATALDAAGNLTSTGAAVTLIDNAAPTIATIFTRDVDEDGFIDGIELNFNENMNAAGTTAGFTVAGHTISAITFTSTGAGTNNRATLTINETATGLTNELPNVTYDSSPGNIADADGNTTGTAGGGDLASFGPTAPTDGAAPQIIKADVSQVNGTNTTLSLTFSEAIANGAALVAGDFTYVDVSTTGAATLTAVSVANGASTGTATVNTAFIQGDVGSDTIALSSTAQDAAANTTSTGAAVTIIDDTAPTVSTLTTLDNDLDGLIDRIRIDFNENLNPAGTTAGFSVAGHTVSAITFANSGAGTNNRALLTIDETTDGTGALPNVTYASGPGNITDADGNTTGTLGGGDLASFGPTAPIDGAAPQNLTFRYQDNDGNGRIDRFVVYFSETVTAASSLAANDLLLTNDGDFNGAVFGANATDLITGSVSNVTVVLGTEATAVDTNDASGTLAISSQNAFSLTDGTNTNAVLAAQTQATFVDEAKPVFVSSTSDDTGVNPDGTVDQVTLVYSESVAITDAGAGFPGVSFNNSCVAVDADYSSASTTTSIVALTGCTSGDTSILVNPTYAMASGQIQDLVAVPNEMNDAETVTGTDGARPAFLTATTADVNSDGTVDRLDLTFSETVNINDLNGGGDGFPGITLSGGGCTIANQDLTSVGVTSVNVTLSSCTAGNTGILVSPTYVSASVVADIIDNAVVPLEMLNNETVTGLDGAAPVPLSASYLDANSNGTIDRADVTFSSETTNTISLFEAGDHVFNAGSAFGAITPTAAVFVGNVLQISITPANSNVTGSAAALTYTYTNQGTLGSVNDGLGNNTITAAALTVTDTAAPVPLSSTYLDTNSNGTIDRDDVTYSAEIANTLSLFEAGDHVFNATSAFGAVTPTAAVFVGNVLQISITPANSGVTGSAVALTYTYTNQGTLGSVNDALGNNTITSAAITQVDGAAPVPLSSVYRDINSNGTIDRDDVTFSAEIANTLSLFEAADHVFNAGSAFGAITPTAAVFVGNVLQISITPANSNVTGSAAALTYTYTNQGTLNSVNDALGNNTVTAAAITQADGAPPVPLSSTYLDINTDGTIDRDDVTFSAEITNTLTLFEAADHVFNATSAFGAITPTAAVFVGNVLRITITPANINVTGSVAPLTYTYTNQGTLGSVNDALGNNTVTSAAITQMDGAGPVVIVVNQIESKKVLLNWTEAVLDNTDNNGGALFLSNYVLSTGTNPTAADVNPPTSPTGLNYVLLTFADTVIGGANTLSTSNVEDTVNASGLDDINVMATQGAIPIRVPVTVSGLELNPNQTAGNSITVTGTASARSTTTVTTVRYCMRDSAGTLLTGCTDFDDTSTWINATAADGSFNSGTEAFQATNVSITNLANGTVTVRVAGQNSETYFGPDDQVTFTKSSAITGPTFTFNAGAGNATAGGVFGAGVVTGVNYTIAGGTAGTSDAIAFSLNGSSFAAVDSPASLGPVGDLFTPVTGVNTYQLRDTRTFTGGSTAVYLSEVLTFTVNAASGPTFTFNAGAGNATAGGVFAAGVVTGANYTIAGGPAGATDTIAFSLNGSSFAAVDTPASLGPVGDLFTPTTGVNTYQLRNTRTFTTAPTEVYLSEVLTFFVNPANGPSFTFNAGAGNATAGGVFAAGVVTGANYTIAGGPAGATDTIAFSLNGSTFAAVDTPASLGPVGDLFTPVTGVNTYQLMNTRTFASAPTEVYYSQVLTFTVNVAADVTAPPVPVITTGATTTANNVFDLNGTAGADTPSDTARVIRIFNGAALVASVNLAIGQTTWGTQVGLSFGANVFTATSTDAAGNTSAASASVTITRANEAIAPPAPVITTLAATVNADFYTINGTSAADTPSDSVRTIRVLNGASIAGTAVLPVGQTTWSVVVPLTQGAANSFTATSTDEIGNVSAASAAVVITEDPTAGADVTAPPVPVITTGVATVNADFYTIAGTAAADTPSNTVRAIRIFNGATLAATAIIPIGQTTWSAVVSLTQSSANSFTATSTDAFGNASAASAAVVITEDPTAGADVTAPPVPVITTGAATVDADTITISGTAAADTPSATVRTIRVLNGASLAGTAVLPIGQTAWSVVVSLTQSSANSFTATSTDAAGNTSAASAAVVITEATAADTTAPFFVNSTPTTGAVQVSIAAGAATLNFNETVLIATQANIDIAAVGGASVKNGNATVLGNALTINYNALANGTSYVITVLAGAVTDAVANPGAAVTIFFTTASAAAPDITSLSISAVAATTATINATFDVIPTGALQWRVGPTAYSGTFATFTNAAALSNTQAVTGLTAGTTAYFQVRATVNGATTVSVPLQFTTATAASGMSIDAIRPIKTLATAPGFPTGLEWEVDITINNLALVSFSAQFAPWVFTSGILSNVGRTQFSVNGGAFTILTADNAFNPIAGVAVGAFDNEVARGGRQITVRIQLDTLTPTAVTGIGNTSFAFQAL
jgi:hypothetical protein